MGAHFQDCFCRDSSIPEAGSPPATLDSASSVTGRLLPRARADRRVSNNPSLWFETPRSTVPSGVALPHRRLWCSGGHCLPPWAQPRASAPFWAPRLTCPRGFLTRPLDTDSENAPPCYDVFAPLNLTFKHPVQETRTPPLTLSHTEEKSRLLSPQVRDRAQPGPSLPQPSTAEPAAASAHGRHAHRSHGGQARGPQRAPLNATG